MARYILTSWFIGDSVPLRFEIFVNEVYTNSETIPTIDVYDSSGTKKVTAQEMTVEATGRYIYYADCTDWAIGKCFWVSSYTVSAKSRKHQAMFFVYDQTTWYVVERVRDALDGLQEGELASATIFQKYEEAARWVDRKASASADADLKTDTVFAQASLQSYIAYLTDRERANVDVGTSAMIMVNELRLLRNDLLDEISRVTVGPGEVQRGIFRPTQSAVQLTDKFKSMDKGNWKASTNE